MIEAEEPAAPSGEARIARARADFVATLGRRLTALRNTLRQLEEEPASRERRDMLQRRLHALGSAARVLGFDGVADALADAERAMARSAPGKAVPSTDLAEVSRALDLLPSIAWGAKPPRAAVEATGHEDLVAAGWPLCILVFGPPALESSLSAADDALVEVDVAADLESFRELAERVGPDVAVIDGDLRGARELLDHLAHDPELPAFPVIVVGAFEHPEAASGFVSLGAARVLPKPVGPDTLWRAVLEASRQETALRGPREPIGDVTVEQLAQRIAAEVRRGLVDGVEPASASVSVPLGEGTDVLAAVWGAVARVRELLTMRSRGSVRFSAGGPEGAVPLAPWTSVERRAGERGPAQRRSDGVRLQGRRAVVVDDDPAVVWFLSGLLKTSGVEVAEAHDGLRARDLVLEGMPDLVISDVLMPGLDGFSLCREIKRDVAVRDVPVILLSWKEDLLQRVRELGGGADGYLRKEAAASTVLSRIREVLRPRARIESRLASGGEVRGRLDGLTTRSLLELARRYQPSCRVIVRDAVYLYELELRDERLRSATRTAADGSFERGSRVLDAVVGASAGRFVVTPTMAHARRDVDGTLEELLGPRIQRARRLARLFEGPTLGELDAVVVDEATVGAYLDATPEPLRSVFAKLLGGAGPREILAATPEHRFFLEQVLGDIARRGGVLDVVRDGRSVDLGPGTADPAARGEAPEATPGPLFTLDLSPVPPDVGDRLARWEQPDVELRETSAPLPFSRSVTPEPVREPAVAEAGFRDEPRTAPGVGPVLMPLPTWPAGEAPAASGAAPVDAPAQAAVARDAGAGESVAGVDGEGPIAEDASAERDASSNATGPDGAEAPPSGRDESMGATGPVAAEAGAQEASPGRAPAAEVPPQDAGEPTMEAAEPVQETVRSVDAEGERDGPLPLAGHTPATLRAEPSPKGPAADGVGAPEASDETALPSAKPIAFPRRNAPASAEPGRARSAPSAPPSRPGEKALGTGKTLLIAGAAAVAAYLGITWVRVSLLPHTPHTAASVEPGVSAAPPAAKPAAGAPKLAVQEVGMDVGTAVPADKGVIDVSISDNHPVYIDGSFVGRGPRRKVPVAAGPHDVVIKAPGGDLTVHVEVKAGARFLVTLPPPAP